jgi:hypothetical protein
LSSSSSRSPPLQLNQIAFRVLHQVNRNKPVTLERSKELTKTFVEGFGNEEDISGRHLVLLWISSTSTSSPSTTTGKKGRAFLLEIETEEEYNDNYNDVLDVVRDMTNNVGNILLNDSKNNMNRRKEDDDEYETDSDDEDDDINDWVFFSSSNYKDETPTQQINRSQLPQIVSEWMHDVMMTTTATCTVDDNNNNNNSSSNSSIGSSYVLFEWGDLDLIAHKLNRRRLGMTDDEVTEKEYDEIINERKRILKEKHNVLTFDDWFEHVKGGKEVVENGSSSDNQHASSTSESSTSPSATDHAVHLVLESSVPPWEVELYRPRVNSNNGDVTSTAAEEFRLHPATECIRCLSEDSEESSEDGDDPSNDGIGSYMDFIYRRMMKAAMMTADDENLQPTNTSVVEVDETNFDNHNDKNNDQNKTGWLHCIDARDLGCEAACHADVVRERWNDLLTQEEREGLSKPNEEVRNDACPVNGNGDAMRFLPEKKLNPERIELEDLRSKGLLVRNDDDDDDDEYQDDVFTGLEFTFPSFELFFGQNTDNMYYSPHVKLAYSPFLANCVQSFDNLEEFFIRLFFGGTVPDALDRLNIRETNTRGHVHVRSPILKRWDPESNSYVWEERDDGEEFITCPYFPSTFHLVARGSFPPRTLSSQLYSNLHDFRGNEEIDQKSNSRRQVALAIKTWIIDSIRRNMADPKASDDMETGGEWFEAYLRAVHRDVYDDIDVSDATVLLQKNYMKSISGGRPPKHNIGKIKIPSAKDSFDEIVSRFREQDSLPATTNVITTRVEILAKIMIDIWMSNLFDFSLLLKIANICSNETTKDNIVIVCYVGSAHAKAANKFFCSSSMGFRRKALIGKFAWEDHELKTLDLPSKLWNLSELFR